MGKQKNENFKSLRQLTVDTSSNFEIYTLNATIKLHESQRESNLNTENINENYDFFVEQYGEILKTITKIIYDESIKWAENDKKLKQPNYFYFWPGYKSLMKRKSRLLSNKQGYRGGGTNLDDVDQNKFFHNFNSLYFDTFLSSDFNFKLGNFDLSAGGTAKWCEEMSNSLLKSKTNSSYPFFFLCIHCGKAPLFDNENEILYIYEGFRKFNNDDEPIDVILSDEVKGGDEFTIINTIGYLKNNSIHIYLGDIDWWEWGDTVEKILNNPKIWGRDIKLDNKSSVSRGLPDSTKWPLPLVKDPNEISFDQKDKIQFLRCKLYSIWLASCFISGPNRYEEITKGAERSKCLEIFNTIKQKGDIEKLLEGFQTLSLTFKDLDEVEKLYELKDKTQNEKEVFNHWYSICLPQSVSNGLSPLGGGMILSSCNIDDSLLSLIRSLLTNIYNIFRLFEEEVTTKLEGLITGKKEMAHELYSYQAHEIKDLIGLISQPKPEIISKILEDYFALHFAIDESEIAEYSKKYFSSQVDLYGYFKQAIKIALEIRELKEWIGSERISDDQITKNKIFKDVNFFFENLFKKQLIGFKDISINLEDKKKSWYFFCAIIAAIRNAIKHSEYIWSESLFIFKIETINNKNFFSVINKCKSNDDNFASRLENNVSDINSSASLLYCIENYNGELSDDEKKFFTLDSNLSGNYYMVKTTLPMPIEFIKE